MTFAANQPDGGTAGGVQLTTGARRSTLKVNGPAVTQLPAASHAAAVLVVAAAVSLPGATNVDRSIESVDAGPDPASLGVHVTVWLALYHVVVSDWREHSTVGAVRSMRTSMLPTGVELCAASIAEKVMVVIPSVVTTTSAVSPETV